MKPYATQGWLKTDFIYLFIYIFTYLFIYLFLSYFNFSGISVETLHYPDYARQYLVNECRSRHNVK